MSKCTKCNKTVTKKSPGLQCRKCCYVLQWYHAACAAISNDQLTNVYANTAVERKCRACVNQTKNKRDFVILPDPEEDFSDLEQIDVATGEKETYGSVLVRSVAMARSLRRAGLQPGDVMALGGRNHLNLRIPYYAALMCGLPVAGIDPGFKYDETKSALAILRPKIAFCDHENYEIYSRAVKELGLDTKIVTFFGGECSMDKFMGKIDHKEIDGYRPSYFDTDKVYAWLLSTSGTTGLLKYAALKHGAVVTGIHFLIQNGFGGSMIESGQKSGLNLSHVQWITSHYNATNFPLTNTINVQSSTATGTETESCIDLINKYKPSILISSPTLYTLILKQEKPCDFTCLDVLGIGAATVYKELLHQLRARVRKDAKVCQAYGSSETMIILIDANGDATGSCGQNTGLNHLKLIDITTGAEVTEPLKHGELWVKGPTCFTEYYNNSEETAKAFTEDGWLKTGDVLCRDEHGNYCVVDRLKLFIKYRGTTVIPPEVEEVIMCHPGVVEVCVTGVPHAVDGERPAAAVVRRRGTRLTARDIEQLVADKLSDGKQLRGGVVFMESLPKTSTGKVMRPKVKSLVMELLAKET